MVTSIFLPLACLLNGNYIYRVDEIRITFLLRILWKGCCGHHITSYIRRYIMSESPSFSEVQSDHLWVVTTSLYHKTEFLHLYLSWVTLWYHVNVLFPNHLSRHYLSIHWRLLSETKCYSFYHDGHTMDRITYKIAVSLYCTTETNTTLHVN